MLPTPFLYNGRISLGVEHELSEKVSTFIPHLLAAETLVAIIPRATIRDFIIFVQRI